MAEQLNHTNAELIYLDFSATSMNIAKERAHIRRLENIIWVESWVEGIPQLGIGRFQFSQCSGVLHHLKSPTKGLKVLKDALHENGGMEVMVYGKVGRTGLYQMQDLLERTNKGLVGISKEIEKAKLVLNTIPDGNWFKQSEDIIIDYKTMGDTGIYDMFLHKRDVSYDIPNLYDWISKAGLYLTAFAEFVSKAKLNIEYAIDNGALLTRIKYLLSTRQLQTICELMHGDIIKQSPYISTIANSEAVLDDPLNNLYIYGSPLFLREALLNKSNYKAFAGNKTYFFSQLHQIFLHQGQVDTKMLPNQLKKVAISKRHITFAWLVTEFKMFMMNSLLESNRGKSLLSIFSDFRKKTHSNASNTDLLRAAKNFYAETKYGGLFFLRKSFVSPFPKTGFVNLFQIKSIEKDLA